MTSPDLRTWVALSPLNQIGSSDGRLLNSCNKT